MPKIDAFKSYLRVKTCSMILVLACFSFVFGEILCAYFELKTTTVRIIWIKKKRLFFVFENFGEGDY